MAEKDLLYNLLREQVEHFVGKEMKMRRHFDMLAEAVFTHTRNMVSPTTLRRFWGYQEAEVEVSKHTLDVLSELIGYRNWDNFSEAAKDSVQSGVNSGSAFCQSLSMVVSEELKCGQTVIVTWLPDRRVELVHEGGNVYRVVNNENSKLQPGDTFQCLQLVEGQPLLCTDLRREGHAPMSYIGGKGEGIRFILE